MMLLLSFVLAKVFWWIDVEPETRIQFVDGNEGNDFSGHVLIDGKPICETSFNYDVAKVICR